ncbi:hypothetical protein DLJ53_01995 [Acuticoccus sediminis]|uniref:Uncharacterized protein n=1 Tax=Acuticoccus sediminis TaxID=2184697 RepID=A0A8B2NVD2_9HYPH|nr:hypothetical protein [Acuticoccus sediminis]RAI03313.1 hypothetical protein DLJ53_01995 [Acuticoccus sediminis]
MNFFDPFIALARVDSLVGLPFAIAIASIALWRRRRPLTFNRIVEVGLPALLLVMMAIRYALLAPFVAAFPGPILGAGAGGGVGLAGVFVATSVVGFMSWDAGVLRKLVASLLLLALAIGEMVLNESLFDPRWITEFDTYVGIGVAAIAVIFAVFNWAHRSATPSPLGGAHEPPLDY